MTKKPAWSILRYCALLVIGNAMFALGFNLFLLPNSLNVGGLSGIAMILQRVLGKGGIGLYTAVMNVPLFVIGYKRLGRGFSLGRFLAWRAIRCSLICWPGFPRRRWRRCWA